MPRMPSSVMRASQAAIQEAKLRQGQEKLKQDHMLRQQQTKVRLLRQEAARRR